MKYAVCQNCDNCTNINLELNIGECKYDGEVSLKGLCEGFMWNYDNKNEYEGEIE